MKISKISKLEWHSTTILAVRRDNKVAIGGDGQVSLGNTIIKQQAKKIRRLYNDKVLVGFAGTVADAFTLFARLEAKLEQYSGKLLRASIELAKEWRTEKILRRLDALLVVADSNHLLLVSGSGEVVEPDDNIIGIGSGGPYAVAAARALMKFSNLSAKEIVKEALTIAANICIFTNDQLIIDEL